MKTEIFSTDNMSPQSLKYYRDLKNVLETARQEGYEEGKKRRSLELQNS